MSSNELKLELIHWLTNLQDRSLLQTLRSIKDSSADYDWANDLSSQQKKSIQKGIEDIANGRTMSSEDFWKKYAQK